MPSYPTISLGNSCQHVPIRLSLSLSLLIILYTCIVWLLCGIVIKVHVDALVSFETIILIIVPLFSRLLINFVNYVNVYYFHVFWRPKVLHNDQCYISLLHFSCYLFG